MFSELQMLASVSYVHAFWLSTSESVVKALEWRPRGQLSSVFRDGDTA